LIKPDSLTGHRRRAQYDQRCPPAGIALINHLDLEATQLLAVHADDHHALLCAGLNWKMEQLLFKDERPRTVFCDRHLRRLSGVQLLDPALDPAKLRRAFPGKDGYAASFDVWVATMQRKLVVDIDIKRVHHGHNANVVLATLLMR